MQNPLDERLMQALVSVADGLDLTTTLDRILDAAIEVTGARYGALGVLGADHEHLSQFRYVGMTPAQAAAVGGSPRGRGVLGELIRNPAPLRLRHLAQHPAATGFPPNHPPMDSFLGVPVRAGTSIYGNLYLTEKPGGFDDVDQARVVALAAAAGVAIDNAQLFESAQVAGQWQAAAAHMANAALRGEDGGTVLQLLVEHACAVAGATAAVVLSRVDDELWPEVHAGTDTDVDNLVATIRAAATSHPLSECLEGSGTGLIEQSDGGVIHLFPITTDTRHVGTLALVWPAGSLAANADRLAAVQGMAVQAAVSLSLDVARLREQKLMVYRDRDRIARDLHDLVVQRLFASGVSLQVLARRQDLDSGARERITELTGELDATIAQIRNTIFELRDGLSGTWQLTEHLQDEVDRMADALGCTPDLQVDADLTSLDADDISPDSVAVLREGLSNVARHARAASVLVRVWFRDGVFGIEVIDDGVGPGAGDRFSGLANLRDRAMARGGTCELVSGATGGSVLRWSVPLHASTR